MKKQILTIFLIISVVNSLHAQEFWTGTKSTSSAISRTGQTGIGTLNFRFSGNTGILEHAAATGNFYLRSVAYGVTGDSGSLSLNDIGGNVGIGTPTPQAILHIAQNDGAQNTPRASLVLSRFWASNANTRASSIFQYTDGVNDKIVFAVAGLGGVTSTPLDISQAKMVVQANGNIGIGTINPAYKLDVKGVSHFSGEAFSQGGLRVLSAIGDNVNGAPWYGIGVDTLQIQKSDVQLAGFYGLNFQTGSGQMVMTNAGNVGIGNTAPTAKLAVNGTVRAQEVVVQTAGWPDYVFKKDYRLPDIDSLSQQIKVYGHLPDMPSAVYIAQNGQNLGEMNKKLLQKVEELTLYLIQQKEQNDKLQKEVEHLTGRMNEFSQSKDGDKK